MGFFVQAQLPPLAPKGLLASASSQSRPHASRDSSSDEDVDVVPEVERTWKAVDYLWLWLADGATVGTMQQAGSVMSLGSSWRKAAVAMYV